MDKVSFPAHPATGEMLTLVSSNYGLVSLKLIGKAGKH